jgi:hypothetical protein
MECAYHPEKEAVSVCSKCGRPLCDECSKSPDNLCIDCSILPSEADAEETAELRLMNWNGWISSFLRPRKAFEKSGRCASFAGTAMNLLAGLVNAGIVSLLLLIIGKAPAGAGAGLLEGFSSYTNLFMIFLFMWLATALISYSFAMLVGGMGSLKQHLYMASLVIPLSPFAILLLVGFLSFLYSINIAVLILGVVLITVYIMDIAIVAIQEAHRFGFLQSAVSGVIPVIITGAAGLLMFVLKK